MNERMTSMILVAMLLAGTILSVTMAMEASDLGSQTAPNEELVIFCGAGFTGAMSEIAELYENSSNSQVRFNFDGLPALRVQIEEGAYADLLISPDQRYMDPLVDAGFIGEDTVEAFASNKVAVVLPPYHHHPGPGHSRDEDRDGNRRASHRGLCPAGP